MTFHRETFDHVYPAIYPLWQAHWCEIAQRPRLMWLNPDIDIYRKAADHLLVVTARDRDDNLVGYVFFFVNQHVHYKHIRVATEDIHFLRDDHRRGLAGYRMIKEACRLAFEAGCDLVVMREKVGHEHPELMQRIGFQPADVSYTLVQKDMRE